jgi:hypothetical protein
VTGVFISYRPEDAAGWAGRLQEAVRRELPENEVFYDIGSIGLGEDFVEEMRRSLESCAVAIVMIGPRWLDARDEAGNRRLDDPEDWVRLEVVESLQRQGLRVVPVLVGSASMPRAAELPEPLKPLARRNAHEITDKRWEYDVTQLVAALKKLPSLAGAPARPVSAESQPLLAAKPRAEARPAVGAVELRRPGTVFRDGNDGPEMVVIPAGEFLMGCRERGRPLAPRRATAQGDACTPLRRGEVRRDVRRMGRLCGGWRLHAQTRRPRLGPRPAAGHRCELAGRAGLRVLAREEDGPALPAALGGRVGVRGARRDDDAVSLG